MIGSCLLSFLFNDVQPVVATAAAEVAMNCRRFMVLFFWLNENDEAKEQAKRKYGEAKRER